MDIHVQRNILTFGNDSNPTVHRVFSQDLMDSARIKKRWSAEEEQSGLIDPWKLQNVKLCMKKQQSGQGKYYAANSL